MKVLITGALGNLGQICVQEALRRKFSVIAFDQYTPGNRRAAKPLMNVLSIVFGDICDSSFVASLLEDVDAIIHLAALIPPATEQHPKLAHRINVIATQSLIDQAAALKKPPLFIFPSSVTVFGLPQRPFNVKTTDDVTYATDHYTQHKITLENYLKTQDLPWIICRVGVSVDARTLKTDRETFKKLLAVDARNPLEYVHPKDIAFAFCEAIMKPAAQKKTLLLGGGKSCQITQRQFLATAFDALGLYFPQSLHGEMPFYTHHLDTTESQMILGFQRHSFADYQQEMQHKLRWLKRFISPFRRLINPLLVALLKKL